MARQTNDENGSSEELLLIIKDLVEPIDFDSLTESGVLEEKGNWYKLHKITELPKAARSKIRRIKIGSRGTFLKFRSPNKKLEKLLIQEAKVTPVRSAAIVAHNTGTNKEISEETPAKAAGKKARKKGSEQ